MGLLDLIDDNLLVQVLAWWLLADESHGTQGTKSVPELQQHKIHDAIRNHQRPMG